jgi:hypothetical protein
LPNVGAVNKGGGTGASASGTRAPDTSGSAGDGHPDGAGTMPPATGADADHGSGQLSNVALTASGSAGAAALLVGGLWWWRRRSRPGIPAVVTDGIPDHRHPHGDAPDPTQPS